MCPRVRPSAGEMSGRVRNTGTADGLPLMEPLPFAIRAAMRAVALRRFLLALNILALVLATGIAGGAPTAVAAVMSGRCTQCTANSGAGHRCARMPICGIPVYSTAMFVAPASARQAPPVSKAEYAVGPVAFLAGEAPKTDPPPPRSLPAF